MSTESPQIDQPACEDLRTPVVVFCIEALSVGGAEHMLVIMANEFSRRGWQVHMICLAQAGEIAKRLDAAVSLHVLNKKRGIDPGLPSRLRRCIDSIKPDVINSHLWVANTWLRLSMLGRDYPVVVTEHSRDVWKPAYYRWVDKHLASRAFRLIAVSHDTADFYENSVGVDRQRIQVINNGVDTEHFVAGNGDGLRTLWLNRLPMVEDDDRVPCLIGTVGRLVSAKNHLRLIDAVFALVNDTEITRAYRILLVIVGDGPERLRIQEHVEKLGLEHQVVLAGTRHDIPDVLAAFDIFVLSSDREGHPLTALEAQAAGTPVVLTDAGGSGDAIARQEGQVGGVLVKRDVVELSTAVREMIVDPRLRKARGRFARKFALDNFDKRQMIDKYELLFRSAFV